MPGISNEIINKYSDIISKIQSEIPNAEIVFAQKYTYPVYKQKVRFGVTSMKKASLLEEYIMKAAGLELSGGLDISRLSKLLGMDEIFLEGCIKELSEKKLLDGDASSELRLTESGKKHALACTVPGAEEIDEIEYFIDKKSGIFYTELSEDADAECKDYYSLSPEEIPDIKKYINRKFICDVAKAQGREIETAGGERRITSLISAKILQKSTTALAEIHFKIPDSDKTMYKIWDYAKEQFRDDIAKILICLTN